MRGALQLLASRISIRRMVVAIFTLEIVLFSAGIGYLAYVSGFKNVLDNARQISGVTSDSITRMVLGYLEEPYRLEHMNSHLVLDRQIDFSNQAQIDKSFVEMLKTFPNVINNYVVLSDGYEFGARREDDGSFLVWNSNKARQSLDYYLYDEAGGRQQYIKSLYAYNPVQRPSYLKAISLQRPGWTDVYYSATGRGLVITRTNPLYDAGGQLKGVASCSLLLNRFSHFLHALKMTPNAKVFIVSTKDQIIADADGPTMLPALATSAPLVDANPLLAEGLSVLKGTVGSSYAALRDEAESSFTFDENRYFLHADRINEDNDLQWMAVILIPEKDLTYGLQGFTRQVIGITMLAFLVALLNGLLVARYIVRPLIKVNQLAKVIAEGDFSQQIVMQRRDEVGQLVQTINEMSDKLKNLFDLTKNAADTERCMRERSSALNKAAGSFVPYAFLYMLGKEDILAISPGDHVDKEITVLFTDMRSYTKIAESMSNDELFQFVNRYLDLAVDVITVNNGLIDKFIGDAIMGLFPDGVDDALRAIIELHKEMKKRGFIYNGNAVKVGAGIHFGRVTLGTVGTYARMDTTVLGDSVNLASRLESATKVYGVEIILSENAYRQIKQPEQFHIREIDTVKVKGKSLPIKLYEVFDCDEETLKQLKLQTAPLFQQGLDAYKKGNFVQAETVFRQCRALCPDDKLLAVYLTRCNVLQRIPPGDEWEGVSGI